ncbi:uncharacterized protein EDB91DRAFT_1158070 [Suillus paluster]|uniref:uncharacterized protein n=1 Tax=Suillus paluster TaxID=48578 RepID=UPI001B87FDA2|nr:uncharacterized protein EDB91DRAFT_1158070 [Suillus paluster]KAG1730141.1 hypothetical protein EDB91DRAFT_1158070 [Suillus paluster]
MNRYNRFESFEGRYGTVAEHTGIFNANFNDGRVEDQGSLSGSEDDAGSYLLYPDANKTDADTDDDANTSLTSQTLNADGTPKRPMNAFMIFARRRRPQVSAENQSMRTGDVSKILSREWNAMDLSDKQFYLDQAKHLKDNFNLKYPDYVYRRRPNNSRKKRRADSTGASGDQSSNPEYGEISPVDYHHDSQERYESSGPDVPSSYQLGDSSQYHAYGESDRRASYLSSHGRATPDVVMGPSTSASRGSTSAGYFPPFVPNAPHAPSASYFPSQSGSEGQWHPSSRSSRDDLGRTPVQPWSQSGSDSSPACWSQNGSEPSPHAGDDRHRQYQASPPSWGASNSQPLASNNPSVHSSGYGFPTLNSPFYPSQSSSHSVYSAQQSQISDVSHHYSAVDHVQESSGASRQEAAYHGRYSPVSTAHAGYPQSSNSTVHQYHAQSRNILVSTPLPPAQSMPVYSHTQSTTSPAGSGTDSASQFQ